MNQPEPISGAAAERRATQARPPRSRRRRVLISALRIAILAYLAWCALVYFQQNRILFPAGMTRATANGAIPKNTESLCLDIGNRQKVEAWLLRPASAKPTDRLPLVIFFHGNAETID